MTFYRISAFIKRYIPAAVAVWAVLAAGQPAAPASGAEVIDRIVAIVNNDLISLSDLNARLQPYLEKIKSMGYPPDKETQMIYKVRQEVLNQMIDQKLTDQEIAKYKITVSDKEIDNAIERIKQANSMTDEAFRQAIAKEGYTYAQYRQIARENLMRSNLMNREVKSKVVVTKEDVKAYYDAHPELYGFEEKYHLANVMIKISESPDNPARIQAHQKMSEILTALNSGKSIQDVIQKFSGGEFPVQGGELGTFSLSSLDPKIRDAIKNLSPGQYTDIVETDYGPQIFCLIDKVKSSTKSLEQATPEIENKLYKDIVDQKFEKWLDELRSKSAIKITL